MKSITTQAAEKVYLHSKKAFSLFILTLLLFSSFLILNRNAKAQQLVCPIRAIERITDETAGVSRSPSINADGTRIAFNSTSNINKGTNPEGNNEIWLFDTVTGIFTQVTDETAGDSRGASINADGTRIAFNSTANINGGNPEGNFEIYVTTCFEGSGFAIPTLSEWGLIAMAGILGIVGFMVMRRRKATA